MKISVIIPTLNAEAAIAGLLSMLRTQDCGAPEIIVIDSSSDDNTVAVAKKFNAKTIVIPRQAFNHGKTRNTAAIEASGDILVFMTQDALPTDSSLLSKLARPLEDPAIAAAFARHLPIPGASPLERSTRYFNYPDSGAVKGIDDITSFGIRTFFFSNVCSMIRKGPFLEVGMFPEVRANEDMIMAAKLILDGYKIAYVSGASVLHSHNNSLLTLFKRYYNIGSSIRHNRWILKYTVAEGEGLRLMKEQIGYITRNGAYAWLPRIFLESAIKYAGYRTGLIAG